MDSLILQKEPGYEYLDSEHESSLLYQYIVKYANMKYAIANMINHKALGFEEVITKHFSLKKDDILATIDKWV